MSELRSAELLLLIIVLQQAVAAPVWWLCQRIGLAPRVPAWHWAGAAALAVVTLALPLLFERGFAHQLTNLLAPGIFLLLRLGLHLLLRVPRRDGEHLAVVVGAVGATLLGQAVVATPAWFVLASSLLNTFCLVRTVQCCARPLAAEVGEAGARLVLAPLAVVALLFALRGLGAVLQPQQYGVWLTHSGTANVALLGVFMTFGLLVHLCLGLALALRLLERVRKLSRIDALTALPNRRAMDELLAQALASQQPDAPPPCLLVVDLDHFKRVNDEHGHLVGDRALVHVATVLRETLRAGDVVARLGGEEFVVLLPQTLPAAAAALAERLRERVAAAPLRLGTQLVHLTLSLGLAARRGDDNAESWLQRADDALYRAKAAGRNRVELAVEA